PVVARRVRKLFVREGQVLEIHIGDQIIGTTAEHPFWIAGKGWISAGDIQVGDLVRTEENSLVPVQRKVATGRTSTVFNLSVPHGHTYLVGSVYWCFSVWVHNGGKDGETCKFDPKWKNSQQGNTGANSRILRRRMGLEEGCGDDAHHIVKSGGDKAEPARKI